MELNKPPFFIVGCVRSGTTMIRNLLKNYPHLVCPEETHFFRWSWPIGTLRYRNIYQHLKPLDQHRAMDGITDDEIFHMMDTCTSRKDFNDMYMKRFVEVKKQELPEDIRHKVRWFDKTPQNLYGVLLIAAELPEARFIHIYRNPLDVVASLIVGKVMKSQSVLDAANYWREAIMIMHQFTQAYPERILTINYEEFLKTPFEGMTEMSEFIGEEMVMSRQELAHVKSSNHKYREVLSDEQIKDVIRICKPAMEFAGINFDVEELNDPRFQPA